jgi:hypothetical protein
MTIQSTDVFSNLLPDDYPVIRVEKKDVVLSGRKSKLFLRPLRFPWLLLQRLFSSGIWHHIVWYIGIELPPKCCSRYTRWHDIRFQGKEFLISIFIPVFIVTSSLHFPLSTHRSFSAVFGIPASRSRGRYPEVLPFYSVTPGTGNCGKKLAVNSPPIILLYSRQIMQLWILHPLPHTPSWFEV